MIRLALAIAGLLACTVLSPAMGADVRHEIHFPNLPGYQTLKCDLHMHTVFSDGEVWPTVRVREAWRRYETYFTATRTVSKATRLQFWFNAAGKCTYMITRGGSGQQP